MNLFGRIAGTIFGKISWTPPAWLRAIGRVARSHRLLTSLLIIFLVALAGGAGWGYRYYKSLPKPRRVAVSVDPLPVTKLQEKLQFPVLSVRFDASAAPLDRIGKLVSDGIHLDPSVRGAWRWENDRQLSFRPLKDWPANTVYRISLEKSAVAPHLLLDRYRLDVSTPKFTASFKKLEFYQDPKDPLTKQVVATLEFSHGVAPGELERNLSLAMIGGAPVLKPNAPPFTLDFGLHRRIAYLHSAPLNLPEREDFMKVVVGRNLATEQGGAKLEKDLENKVRIPDLFSFFHVDSAEGQIVQNDEGDPEQFLMIGTSAAAKPEEVAKGLEVYLLPKKKNAGHPDASGEQEEEWSSPREVDAEILKGSAPVKFTLVPSKEEASKLHTFRIKVETSGALYVKIRKGVRALGGFVLGRDYDDIVPVPEPSRSIEIQGDGGVLALNGERKLSIKSRGVPLINYEIARVPADQINHLVSQTRGEFQNPEFVNYRFNEQDIARFATEKQSIRVESRFKANYSTFDFASHLRPADDGGSPMQGLFFLKARAWDPKKDKAVDDLEADRFILVTDIGMLVKASADGARDVFLQSLKSREPLGGVTVTVLTRNGVPALTGTTGADGRVSFPTLGKPEREKVPVAIVARNGSDVAFIPYSRGDRKLDFSRFDTEGVESVSGTELDAFVFTERGVYRPGDTIHAAFAVTQRNWAGNLKGLPIETEVKDARGLSVQVRKSALPESGFAELSYQTAYESPSGDYEINVYLVRDGKRSTRLGSTNALVKEFLPDRMKIESALSANGEPTAPASVGWANPNAIRASVTLRNLYGTPATDRRIAGRMILSPGRFRFEQYKDYTFYDRLRDTKSQVNEQTVELGEKKTGDDGGAAFDLNLERFADATYEMTFYGEGFEAEGGRSVNTQNSVLVSALPYVIGYKPDGDLGYLDMKSERSVELIAIDNKLQRTAIGPLTLNVILQSYVSVLTKRDDGTWAYESVKKESVAGTETVSIPAEGLKVALPTETPGSYRAELREKDSGARLAQFVFTVVGHGDVSRSLDKNAELQVKLSRTHYNSGDEIEASITAPYTGSGLITVERDKVYAHQWFKADTTSSLQRIRLPDGFDGTGYVNVSFIRALDSREIFMSPLSCSVMPFTANLDRRRLKIDLDAARLVKPGEPLHIRYKTDRASKVVVFAVDEGILQVTNYQLPDPLGYFFRKSALMVQTFQIVDLLLPEYSLLHAAAFGGDGDERRLNPFRRVTEKPVVFWSGVLDADTTEREVVYNVPDYFNGTLKVMAVAFTPEATGGPGIPKPFPAPGSLENLAQAGTGSAQQDTIVRGPYVLTPGVPTLAAPGDRFEVGVTVANNVVGSGPDAKVAFGVAPSEHLEVLNAPREPLAIPEGREVSVVVSVRVKEKLGNASLTFTAGAGDETSSIRSTLSVRPAVPLMTEVRSGNFTKAEVDLPIRRAMYPDFRHLNATVSALPLGLAHGLDDYLQNYPNGCSEQITSGAFCRLLVAGEADFALKRPEVAAQMEKTFATLRRRQNDQGAFGYWASGGDPGIDFLSTYVMHFMVEAKEAGFPPPPDLFASGLRYLHAMVAKDPGNLWEARTIAYAIYVLTREEVITTNYILNLRDSLEKRHAKEWKSDLTGVYLAGSLALLKDNDKAQQLISQYKMGAHEVTNPNRRSDFYQPLGADSQYVAILARHFPARLRKLTAHDFQAILDPIGKGHFNTLTAAYAVLALKSYSQHLAATPVELGIGELGQGGNEAVPLPATGKLVKSAAFSDKAKALRFSARPQIPGLGVFYSVSETGFDLEVPTMPISDGMEIYRELVDKKGAPLNDTTNPARLGEPVTVRLRIRSLNGSEVSSVAIMDLLPGGFEIVGSSLRPGVGSNGCEYVEVREDRAVLFTSAPPSVRNISYEIKPCNRGVFVVPPVFAESMYDRTVKARGLGGKIRVVEAK